MAKKPETVFKERVARDLKALKQELGGLYFRKIQAVALLGLPDYFLSVQGRFWGMELKVDAEPTPRQQYELDEIVASGGIGLCATPENWPQVRDWIRKELTGERSASSARRPSGLRRRR